MLILRTRWTQKLIVAVTAITLVFSQTAPALAYGPNGTFAGYNDLRAMGYFRVPLGASPAEKERAPSFGFTVQRQFQFNNSINEVLSGSFRNSTNLTVDMMDLRFGMDRKLSGFDVGGFNALQARARLNAADNGNGGNSTWVWLVIGGAVLVGGVVLAVGALKGESDPCQVGPFGGPNAVPECQSYFFPSPEEQTGG